MFTQDSDPIEDLDIGMMHVIKQWVETLDIVSKEKKFLVICAAHGKTEFVKYLLEKGHDVHESNDAALQTACDSGYARIVKLLLDAGANVHACGREGNNKEAALQYAVCRGYTDIIKLLLDAGADVHADDDVALRYANYIGKKEIIKMLNEHIKMDKIDDLIQKNKDEFNEDVVDVHHDERFLVKLHNRFKKIVNIVPYLVRIAIVDVIIIVISIWIWNSYIRKDRNEITLKQKIENLVLIKR